MEMQTDLSVRRVTEPRIVGITCAKVYNLTLKREIQLLVAHTNVLLLHCCVRRRAWNIAAGGAHFIYYYFYHFQF